MQIKEIRAFRQRLVRGGFRDISIFDCGYGFYSVCCTSRYGEKICRRMSLVEINATPHLVWFENR